MGTEIFATLEIRKKEMRFVVVRYRNKQTTVIFKEVVAGDWLNNNDVVNDTGILSSKLKKVILNFEKDFNYQIESIIVVLPSKTLMINDHELHHNLNESVPISEQTMEEIYDRINQNYKVVGYENIIVRPYSFKILNSNASTLPPVGRNSSFILTQAKIYTIQNEVSQSHAEVVKKTGKAVLLKTIDMFALGKQVASDINFKETFALINWGYENTEIGIYSKEALGDALVINKGTKHIIEAVASKIKAKPRDVEKYLYKLIDCSTNSIVKSDLVFRKYNSETQSCINLSSDNLRELFTLEIKKMLSQIEETVLSVFKSATPLTIYYFGRITEVAGFAEILGQSKLANITKIYYSSLIGGDELWVTACLGSVAIQRTLNKANPYYVITSLGGQAKQQIMKQETQTQPVQVSQSLTNNNQEQKNTHFQEQQIKPPVPQNYQHPGQYAYQNGVLMPNQMYNNNAYYQPNQRYASGQSQQANFSQNNQHWQAYGQYQNQNVQALRVPNQTTYPQGYFNHNQQFYNNRPMNQEEVYQQQQLINKNNNNF